jgi:hypothetical protein
MPILYRSINIQYDSQLVSLADTMTQAESRGHHVGGFVRSLNLEDIVLGDATAESLDCFMTLLLYVDRLEEIVLPSSTTRACITLLRRTCHALSDLRLCGDLMQPSNTVLSCVGTFEQLTVLNVTHPSGHTQFPETGWRLPRLRQLSWNGGDNDFQDLVFLGKCHFKSLRILAVFRSLSDERHAAPLTAFLKRHPSVEDLRLMFESAEIAETMLCLSSCSTFVALGSATPRRVASFLPPCTQFLRICAESDGVNARDILRGVLRSPGNLREVHLEFRGATDEVFEWQDAGRSPELAMFAAKLLPFAARLRGHGISLIDEVGEMAYIAPV